MSIVDIDTIFDQLADRFFLSHKLSLTDEVCKSGGCMLHLHIHGHAPFAEHTLESRKASGILRNVTLNPS